MGCDFPLGSWTEDIAGEWNAEQNTVLFEGISSPTQWAAVRNAAQHIMYMAANSNQMKNGYQLSVVADKTVDTITGTVSTEIEPVDLSIDTNAFGTDQIVYSCDNLPDGFTLDPQTGILTGTPVKSGKSSPRICVSVTIPGEQWISVEYKVSMNIAKQQ